MILNTVLLPCMLRGNLFSGEPSFLHGTWKPMQEKATLSSQKCPFMNNLELLVFYPRESIWEMLGVWTGKQWGHSQGAGMVQQ